MQLSITSRVTTFSISMKWFHGIALVDFPIIPCLNKDVSSEVSSNEKFSSMTLWKLFNAVSRLKRIVGLINNFFSPTVVLDRRS